MASTNSTIPASAAPGGLSAKEVVVLTSVAKVFYRSSITLALYMVFYGIYFVINGMAVYSILSRRRKSRSTWVLFACLVLVFIITTLQTSTVVANTFLVFRTVLIDNVNLPLAERIHKTSAPLFMALVDMNIVCTSSTGFGLGAMICDALTVWRAMKIANPPRSLIYLLYFLMFATMVLWIPYIYLNLVTISSVRSGVRAILGITGSVLGITVNVLATAIIAVMAYRHKLLAQSVNHRLHAGRVLVFLAESGFMYAVLQILAFALSLSPNATRSTRSADLANPTFVAVTFWLTVANFASTVYTPIMILIVTQKVSLVDSYQFSTISTPGRGGGNTGEITTLNFADTEDTFARTRRDVESEDFGFTFRDGDRQKLDSLEKSRAVDSRLNPI